MQYAPPVRLVRPTFIQIERDAPPRLYRFFKCLEHAQNFADGRIWISTLEACRKHEDPQQGDSEEGKLGNKLISDALVLCTTLRFDPSKMSDSFGNYCVEITEPLKFFVKLTEELMLRYPIDRFRQAQIIYAEREFEGTRPGRIGFVKPPDKYAEQEEHRMLWTVSVDKPLIPGKLYVPGLKRYCRLLASDS
jgi:hypothetical protein